MFVFLFVCFFVVCLFYTVFACSLARLFAKLHFMRVVFACLFCQVQTRAGKAASVASCVASCVATVPRYIGRYRAVAKATFVCSCVSVFAQLHFYMSHMVTCFLFHEVSYMPELVCLFACSFVCDVFAYSFHLFVCSRSCIL